MRISDDAFATIMLMSQVSPDRAELVKPLSQGEYHALRERVRASELRHMSALTDLDMSGMMQYLSMTEKEAYRLCLLLNRVLPISISMEGFMNAGIEITTIDDEKYPEVAYDTLGRRTPPMLYYAGRPEVFRQWSISIIGSEVAKGDTEARVRALSRCAVARDLTIVSDGATGFGRIAEDEAYKNGGFSIEVLAGGMSERLKDERVKEMIEKRRLVLVSIQHPDAPVTKPHAIERNKLVYALSLASFVFSARDEAGNAWEGATEAIKILRDKYIYALDTPLYPGNAKLINRGAIAYDGDETQFEAMYTTWQSSVAEQLCLFDKKSPRR